MRLVEWAGMEVHFFAEVDASGAVVSLEEGALSDIPDELLALVGKLVTNRLFQASFLWLPEGRQTPCRVQISQSRSTDEDRPTVYVFGDWEQQIPFGLTVRELDVLTLIALGLQSSAIAEQFTLSPRTVTTHIDRIMRKLGVQNRVAAAVLAVDGGLIRLPYPGKHDQALELLGLGRSIRDAVVQQDTSPRRMLKPMKIGAAFPLHGPASADGAEMARSSRLAVEELNARGGIDGRKVELEIVDVDILEADGILTAFETLVARGADVLTSGYHARQEVAHEFAAAAQIPYLHTATMDAMAQRVRDDPGRYATVFQVCPSDSVYAPRFVEMMTLLRDRGSWQPSSRRLTVVQSAWAETDLGMLRAADIAERDGWDLSLVEVETGQQGGWSALAHQLSAAEPAAVMIGNYFVEDAVAFLDSFLQNPGDTLLYTLYSPSVPEFRRLMGERADGLLWATVSGTYSDSYARAFADRYRDRFGVSPGRSHAGIAYDRVGLIAHAWKYAENPRDSLTVAKELRQVIYRGVNGVYCLGDRSQTTLTYPDGTTDPSLAQAHLVFQIQGGHQRIIDPAPYADGEFVLPSWMRRRVLR